MHTRLVFRAPTFLAAAILCCLTGIVLAQDLPDPARWDTEIRAFAAQDRVDAPPQRAIVLTGSSSIARWHDQAAAALAPLTVIPRGFGGSTMGDLQHHLQSLVLQYKPRAVLIYEGDNDTALGISEKTIIEQLQAIIAEVHSTLPDTRIYVMSVKPSVLRAAIWPMAQSVNQGYADMAAADPLVYYVDAATPFLEADGTVMDDVFIDDRLHFNALGNLIWGAIIRAALMPQEARHEGAH